MSRVIKKIDNKYRVWCTVVDSYITELISKEELIKFLFWDKFENLIEKLNKDIIELDENKNINLDTDKIFDDRTKKFEYFLSNIKEAGIILDIKDNDGVDINTNEIN